MPYKIKNQGNKYQVVDDTGKVFGEHETKAKAMAQMRALYVHAPDVKSGRRNNAGDVERLYKIRTLVKELLSEEMTETEDEVEREISPMEQLEDYLEELPAKMNLFYVKSLGLDYLPDLAVKSIGEDEIQGYITLWGSPKITDVEAEYFTPETNFWDANLKNAGYKMPLTWDHAQDKSMTADPRIGTIEQTGDDEIGRWYVAKLDRSHRYRKAIDKLINEGKLGTSSDSAPQYVERQKTGKSTWLKTWPLFAAALTDTPAEPRMIGNINFLKSLGIALPDSSDMSWKWANARIKRLSINF